MLRCIKQTIIRGLDPCLPSSCYSKVCSDFPFPHKAVFISVCNHLFHLESPICDHIVIHCPLYSLHVYASWITLQTRRKQSVLVTRLELWVRARCLCPRVLPVRGQPHSSDLLTPMFSANLSLPSAENSGDSGFSLRGSFLTVTKCHIRLQIIAQLFFYVLLHGENFKAKGEAVFGYSATSYSSDKINSPSCLFFFHIPFYTPDRTILPFPL